MSLKNDAVVRTLSILEFDFCFHLEYNANIKSFTSQPFGFHYQFNNRKSRYTPDFLITDHNEQLTLFEVKLPHRQLRIGQEESNPPAEQAVNNQNHHV